MCLHFAPEGDKAVHYTNIPRKIVWNKWAVSAFLAICEETQEAHGDLPSNSHKQLWPNKFPAAFTTDKSQDIYV